MRQNLSLDPIRLPSELSLPSPRLVRCKGIPRVLCRRPLAVAPIFSPKNSQARTPRFARTLGVLAASLNPSRVSSRAVGVIQAYAANTHPGIIRHLELVHQTPVEATTRTALPSHWGSLDRTAFSSVKSGQTAPCSDCTTDTGARPALSSCGTIFTSLLFPHPATLR